MAYAKLTPNYKDLSAPSVGRKSTSYKRFL